MSIILGYLKGREMVRFIRKQKIYLVGCFLALVLFLGGIWVFATTTVPNFEALADRKIIESTKIYDRTGEILLYDVHGDIKRTVLAPEKIPRHVKNATIAMEDQNFHSHFGISPSAILRAFFVNIFSGELKQGGSTITQQLVKTAFLTSEKTFIRKIKELVLALKVEARYSKDEILNFYLNEIPYGSNAYGVEAASRTYFGKPAEELTLAESAYLAAMLQAPTRYSPYGSHTEELEARKNVALERMLEEEFITKEEYDRAMAEEVKFLGRGIGGIRAPHFSLYVKEYLVEKYGEDVVEKGGLKVITTLNWAWQEKIEELVKTYSEGNEKNFNAFNSGLVATDPKTGQILVMVGSRDYFENPRPEGCTPGVNCKFDPQVNIALRSRQPGSAFKPFVYAAAFNKDYTPDTVIFDLPTEFSPSCHPDGSAPAGVDSEKCYHPQNYDEKFRGPVSFREALAQSINVPSVKVLYLAGLNDSLKLAREMGITTLSAPERYGLTLVLGGGEVKLLEMVNAYGVLANEGMFTGHTPILRIGDSSGKALEEYQEKKTKVMNPDIALMLSGVLSDNDARAPAFGESSALYFPERDVAVKTGTTNDYRDAWVVGFTPNIALGVWAGNSDNTPMEKKVAGFIAAPLWNAALKEIFKELPKEDFRPAKIPRPEKPVLYGEWRGGRVYIIDKISQKLATEFTPEELIEKKVIKEIHSILYWVDKNNPWGERPRNPDDDPQFKNWESSLRSWVASRGIPEEDESVIPKESDDLHRPENFPLAQITLEPLKDGFRTGDRVKIIVLATGRFPIEQVDLFSGAEYLGSVKISPYEFSIIVEGIPGEEIKLLANVYDRFKNKTTAERIIRISEN